MTFGFLTLALIALAAGGSETCPPVADFLSWTDFGKFERQVLDGGKTVSLTSPVVEAEMDWDELILSWNASGPTDETLKVEARSFTDTAPTAWFDLGTWTPDRSKGVRQSLNGQKTSEAEVLTDTLSLRMPARRFQVRLTVRHTERTPTLKVDFLAAALHFTAAPGHNPEPDRSAWGRLIEVPQRAQGKYPNGNVLCSPTSVSMVLSHWAKVEGKPAWDLDVPEVASGVYDTVWKGTGNWPFNTAFAGLQPGMRAYVARLASLADLERQIAAGFPVICSVSYDLLKGKGKVAPNDGHLVVLVGFDEDGTPVFNDPGRSAVRLRYQREHFEAAWRHSGRTVYMIHPIHRRPAPLLSHLVD